MRLSKDSTSYRCRGIIRRDYRHTPLTPEEEVPRHKATRRKKKRHVHDYKVIKIGRMTVRSRGYYLGDRYIRGDDYETDKVIYVCQSCGNRRGYSGRW